MLSMLKWVDGDTKPCFISVYLKNVEEDSFDWSTGNFGIRYKQEKGK
jgi:hypothetical protein